jgi:hypothetical protein
MINYLFGDELAGPKPFRQRRNLVKLWHEYGRDGVTIGKKA